MILCTVQYIRISRLRNLCTVQCTSESVVSWFSVLKCTVYIRINSLRILFYIRVSLRIFCTVPCTMYIRVISLRILLYIRVSLRILCTVPCKMYIRVISLRILLYNRVSLWILFTVQCTSESVVSGFFCTTESVSGFFLLYSVHQSQ